MIVRNLKESTLIYLCPMEAQTLQPNLNKERTLFPNELSESVRVQHGRIPGLASRQLDTWEIYKAIYLVLYPVYGIEEIVFQRFRNTGRRRWIKMEFVGKSWFDRNNMKCTVCCRFMGDFAATNKFCWIYRYTMKKAGWRMIVARKIKAFVVLTGTFLTHRFFCIYGGKLLKRF